jgi:parallel beta-helix repeat protein
MNITARNITLDCNDHYIQSIQNYSGIYSDQIYTTIKNCNVSMGIGPGNPYGSMISNSIGITLYKANYSVVEDNLLFSQGQGMKISSSYDVNITGNTVSDNAALGLFSYYSHRLNFVGNSVERNYDYGVFIYRSTNHTFSNNAFNDNLYNIFFGVWNNKLQLNHSFDSGNILEGAYRVYNNNSISDFVYDLSTTPDAGMIICVDCENISIKDLDFSNIGQGISFYYSNDSNIRNVTVDSSFYGLWASNSQNISISNSNISNSIIPIKFEGTGNSSVDSSFLENSHTGLHAEFSSSENSFNNNTILNNIEGFYFSYGS